MASLMEIMQSSSMLYGSNAAFIEEKYEAWLADPASVEVAWRSYFEQAAAGTHDTPHSPIQRAFAALPRQPQHAESADISLERKQVAVLQMINAYRFLGVRIANLDPLARHAKPEVPELSTAHYGFTDADMETTFETGSLVAAQRMTLREIHAFLMQTYCSSIGAEYMYISDIGQKRWLQQRLEGSRGTAEYTPEKRREILQRLTAAETLERYLHTKYVGQKRFSLEGGETMIPMLDHLLQRAGAQGVAETVIGMAHRGRLNVLVNILGKMPSMLFAEFEGIHSDHLVSGDVKYHNGFASEIALPDGNSMHVTLAFNPSHLEIVSPVVEGSVRARQHTRGDKDGRKVLPVIMHGDSAFIGQGVVMETFNLSQTRGYGTGGSIHIIINNQIGFTTSDVRDIRSSTYCTDVAKMVEAPIFHVNADNPEAVLLVTEIALDYRMEFGRDVVIDLVCFRKLGHNEQDEPLVTQPFMYRYINQHPGMRALYARRLLDAGVVGADEPEKMIADYRKAMDEGHSPVKTIQGNSRRGHAKRWSKYSLTDRWDTPVKTSVPRDQLAFLAERLTEVPGNFSLHSRVAKILEDRRAMGKGEIPLDWGMAENLAYASLLTEGFPIRLSGQDCGRGTFFHRHAVLHDQNRKVWYEGLYVPLRNLQEKQADVVVIDSTLTEEAVLAYEYGYATAEPDTLVIWEAQFGDFANGAQVVIDQFITSGEAKWGRLCGLVMLLPHGYEGQGAEHSSGRIERYLQLCADYNIQVVIPSTPAQMFHLLRRQMLRTYRKPLVVFTPKSLLRSKDAASPLEHFIEGAFQTVIPEAEPLETGKVRRVIVCSGKIYYELLKYRREHEISDMAIIRLEQLYPFPHVDFQQQINKYKNASEVVWCQEEPGNQGAWHRIQHYLLRHMRPGMTLGYALRPSSAAPAAGYLSVHNEQQKAVIAAAFRPDLSITNNPGAKRHEN